MVNDSYDYEASRRMSKQSVPSQSRGRELSGELMPAPAKRRNTVARNAFNSGDLKPLHLNAVDKDKEEARYNKEDKEDTLGRQEKRERMAAATPNSGEKERVQKSLGFHHERQYQGIHHPHGQNPQLQQQANELHGEEMRSSLTSVRAHPRIQSGFLRPQKEYSQVKLPKPPKPAVRKSRTTSYMQWD